MQAISFLCMYLYSCCVNFFFICKCWCALLCIIMAVNISFILGCNPVQHKVLKWIPIMLLVNNSKNLLKDYFMMRIQLSIVQKSTSFPVRVIQWFHREIHLNINSQNHDVRDKFFAIVNLQVAIVNCIKVSGTCKFLICYCKYLKCGDWGIGKSLSLREIFSYMEPMQVHALFLISW